MRQTIEALLDKIRERGQPDLASRLQKRHNDASNWPIPAKRETEREGVYLEALRVTEQEPKTLMEVSADDENYRVKYYGYGEISQLLDAPSKKVVPKEFKPDILLHNKNGAPHAYEVKSRLRDAFGLLVSDLNQLLRYQALVKEQRLSAVTVEISGFCTRDAYDWIVGIPGQRDSMVPDLEVLWSPLLPDRSHSWRWLIKAPRHQEQPRLSFKNPRTDTSIDKVIQIGLRQATFNRRPGTVLVPGTTVPEGPQGKHLRELLCDPWIHSLPDLPRSFDLSTLIGLPPGEEVKAMDRLMQSLSAEQRKTMGEHLEVDLAFIENEKNKKKRRASLFNVCERHNFDKVATAYVEVRLQVLAEKTNADIDLVKRFWEFGIKEQPEAIGSLDHLHALMKGRAAALYSDLEALKKRATLGRRDNYGVITTASANDLNDILDRLCKGEKGAQINPGTSERYFTPPEDVERVRRTSHELKKEVAEREQRRITEETTDPARRKQRKEWGWTGPDEGFALPIEHFLLDVMYKCARERGEPVEELKAHGLDSPFFSNEGEVEGWRTVKFMGLKSLDHQIDTDKEFKEAYSGLGKQAQEALRQKVDGNRYRRDYRKADKFLELSAFLAKIDIADFLRKTAYVTVQGRKADSLQYEWNVTTPEMRDKMEAETLRWNVREIEKRIAKHQHGRAHANDLGRLAVDSKAREETREKGFREINEEREKEFPEFKRLEKLAKKGRLTPKETAKFQRLKLRRKEFEIRREQLRREYNQRTMEWRKSMLEVYKKILPKGEVEKVLATSTIEDQSGFKLIYVVRPDMKVIVAEESTDERADRVAHSELAGGGNVYGAGQLRFGIVDGAARLLEIDNGSGHYRPDSRRTLSFVKRCIHEAGIDVSNADLHDALSAGRVLV